MIDLTGSTIGKYELTERLGKGGMATVYKAHQPTLDRDVALKVLHPGMDEDAGFVARFKREAAAIARLRHPNIVQVYDFDIDSDVYYMVMEFIEGTSLKHELRQPADERQPFDLDEITRIFGDLASAVNYAHTQDMIHRDLKPGNVMLDKSGRAVLTDFGIARLLGASQMTMTGAVFGTPAYMSPEQGRGEPTDTRSDIYALGVILYEMATGKVPFEADTPMNVILKHISQPLPSPSEVNIAVPKQVEAVIQKALSKSPDDRYQRAAEMAGALSDAVTEAKQAVETIELEPEVEQPTIAQAVVAETGQTDQQSSTTEKPDWEPPAEWAPTIPAPVRADKQPKPLSEEAPLPSTQAAKSKESMWNMILFGAVIVLILCIAGYALVVVNLFGQDDDPDANAVSIIPSATQTPETTDEGSDVDAGTETAIPATETATNTATPTLTPTPTDTPTPTATPVLLANCSIKPDGRFLSFWDTQKDALGCPTDRHVTIPTMAEELFEGGHMFWRSDSDQVYLVYDRRRSNGVELFEGDWALVRSDLKWDGSDPDGVGLNPPPGLVEPKRGFGWLWRNYLDAEEGRFGWALDREYGFDNLGQSQAFERGIIFKGSSPKLYILLFSEEFFARP
ncbi:MAG: protein kinase [Chloroflexota bacterium]